MDFNKEFVIVSKKKKAFSSETILEATHDKTISFLIYTAVIVFCIVLTLSLTTKADIEDYSVKMEEASEVLKMISQGSSKFTSNLYKAISSKEGNIFISPLSVEVVLALAYMGAAGNTAKEIFDALHLPEDKNNICAGYRALMNVLKSSDNMTLEVANKIFSHKNFSILKEYRVMAEKYFLSGAEEVNFADSEAARKIINSWVESKTNSKIKDLIKKDVLNDLTRLVLVNAVYFKGNWKQKFSPDATVKDKFFLSKTNTKRIPMMNKKAKFGFKSSKELDATILEMPYEGSVSLFIILPNAVDGISNLEQKIGDVDLNVLLESLPVMEVIVKVPKFRLEETTELNTILKEVGMPTMFSDTDADFSGITGKPELYVSDVLQKAFIDVNEEGTEAAAATGVLFEIDCLIPHLKYFIADHPFIILLQERNLRLSLFIGRFSEPS